MDSVHSAAQAVFLGRVWSEAETTIASGTAYTISNTAYPNARLTHAVELLPACWLVFYFVIVHLYLFAVSKFLKARLRIVTQDSVTLKDIDSQPVPRKVVRWKSLCFVLLATARLAGEITVLVFAVIARDQGHGDRWVLAAKAFGVAAWAIATTYLLTKPSVTPVYGLLAFYLLDLLSAFYILLTGVVSIRSLWSLPPISQAVLSLLLIALTSSLPITSVLISPKVPSPYDTPTRLLDSPEDGTSLLSWMLVLWMQPLLQIAYKRTLQDLDVWQLSPFFQHHVIYPVFQRMPGSTLMRKITVFTAFDLVITTLCSLVIAFLSFSFPYFLKKILEALTSSSPELRAKAYHLAILGFLCSVLQQGLELVRQWHSRRSYERVRGALITLVFDKATRRKDTSGSLGHRKMDKDEEDVQGAESGRILNLMNGDAYSVAQWFWEVSVIIRAPIELVAGIIFLYQILGWSCLVGLVSCIIPIIAIYLLGKRNLALTRSLLAATDRRIAVISELVGAIRFLKYYAWESIWVEKAINAREKELGIRYKSNFNSAYIYFTMTMAPYFMNFVTFWCYTKLAHQELTIPVAFAGIAVFNMIQANIAQLPGRVMFFLHTLISVKRLDTYLGEADLEHYSKEKKDSGHAAGTAFSEGATQGTVAFEEATFIYPQHEVRDESAEVFTLKCPSFEFPQGKLSIVCGDNASGKSSLLMAILGEMDRKAGSISRPSHLQAFALAMQDSWLEQATILDNILFGCSYEAKRFEDVLEACALKPDLLKWAEREHTEIGERGISLSGGQRARVALARAIYSQASVVLLDDPLSAVDAHTARHLVDNCFNGPLLKDRTIILVTHHVKLCLPVASLLVRMVAGTAHPEPVDPTHLETIRDVESLDEDSDDVTLTNDATSKDKPSQSDTPVHTGLISKENRAEGSVKWLVYRMYLKAAGAETWIGIFSTILALRGLSVVQQWFVKAWGESYEYRPSSFGGLLPPASDNVNPWLLIYLGLAFLYACILLARLAFGYHGSFKAARALLYACLLRVTKAPSRWLDANPTGRIINRFTADIGSVDSTVTNSVTEVLDNGIGFIASLGAVLYIVPQFAAFAVSAIALYVFMATPYVRCSRDLRRLENNHRSPLFSRFGSLLRGLTVVRAFGQEKRYVKVLTDDLDLFQGMDHFFWTARFYLSLRFDFVGALAILMVQLIALAGGVSQGSAAFAIVLSQQFVMWLHQTCWSYAKLELDINSIERIHDLLSTPQEPPAIVEKNRPAAHWPAKGEIHVEDLAIRYAPHLPYALNGINLHIEAGTKLGIVGRTGSGKTTLALSLLRITEPAAGSIIIDGVDISKIGLRDLRERVTIISQESTLFEGTVRSNLDPNDEHTDHDLWSVLRRVGMARSDDSTEEDSARSISSLDMQVTTRAENFSQGERQLLSIARALLRRTNVFIADEATASVDFTTDEKVQQTLRKELSGCTLITIAHRLRTCIDVDKILVLQDGTVKEYGPPRALLADDQSAFYRLCEQSNELEELKRLAGMT